LHTCTKEQLKGITAVLIVSSLLRENGLFILDARDIDKFLKQTVSNSSELISHGIFLPVKGWDHQWPYTDLYEIGLLFTTYFVSK